MQVVLTEDVKGLGKSGDLVKVADGYARNFLFPRHLATPVTEGALKARAAEREVADRHRVRELENAKALAEKMSNLVLSVHVKSGETGRLFGAVTAQDVAKALEGALGEKIDKRKIALGEPIKHVGQHAIEVRLAQGVSATVTLTVRPDREMAGS